MPATPVPTSPALSRPLPPHPLSQLRFSQRAAEVALAARSGRRMTTLIPPVIDAASKAEYAAGVLAAGPATPAVEVAWATRALGVKSSSDLTDADVSAADTPATPEAERAATAAASLRDEYPFLGTFRAGDVDLASVLPGRPSAEALELVRRGPVRGSPVPDDWRDFKRGKPVDVPAMLASLEAAFVGPSTSGSSAGDAPAEEEGERAAATREALADLRSRWAAARAAEAEALRLPDAPDWASLSRVGGPAFADFLAGVRGVYEAERDLKAPDADALLAAGEARFRAERDAAAAQQRAFWAAQDKVVGAVAAGVVEIGSAEELFDRIAADEPVRVDEVLVRAPGAQRQIDAEISDFDFGPATKARLVDVDLSSLEGFYATLMGAVKAKAAAATA